MSIEFVSISELDNPADVYISETSLAIIGEVVDERTEVLKSYIESKHILIKTLIYDRIKDIYNYDDISFKHSSFQKMIIADFAKHSITEVILECTSLGYAEILTMTYIINALKLPLTIKMIYAEPKGYNKTKKDFFLESYELSEEYNNHKYIKPFVLKSPLDTISSNLAVLVSFLGFEEERLGRIFDNNNYTKKFEETISIIAVPGFQFGWENVSLSKHSQLLLECNQIHYSAADNPYATYKKLEKIIGNLRSNRIVISPIGTKPTTIGTCIFLVNNKEKESSSSYDSIKQIATLYDFPIKSPNRTYGISKIYEYIVKIKYD